MGLLRRVAIGKNGPRKDKATGLLNQGDAQKHADFNQQLVAEIGAKLALTSDPSLVSNGTANISGQPTMGNKRKE